MRKMVPAVVGVPRSSSRRSRLAAAAKNTIHKSADREEQNDTIPADTAQQVYFSVPQRLDVRSGRGKGFFRQPGNLIFQDIIRKHLDAYEKADSKSSKGTIVSDIVHSLLVDHSLRFIKKDPAVGKWYVLSFDECLEKTGHAIRDQVTRMRRKQSLLQEKLPSSTSTPTSRSSSLSSKDTIKISLKKMETEVLSRKAKNPVQKKKTKQPSTDTQQQEMVVEKDEPDLPCFHPVSTEEEDDPWSDQSFYTATVYPSSSLEGFLGTDILVPLPLSGDGDDVYPLGFHQCDESLAHDSHVELLPQCTLPQQLPSTPRHLRPHRESIEDMVRQSGVMQAPTWMMMPTIRRPPVPRVSPETKRELYILPSWLHTSHEIDRPSSVQTRHEILLPSSVQTSHEIVSDEEDPLISIHTRDAQTLSDIS